MIFKWQVRLHPGSTALIKWQCEKDLETKKAWLTPKPQAEEYNINLFIYQSRRSFHPARLYKSLTEKFVIIEQSEVEDDQEEGKEDEDDQDEDDQDKKINKRQIMNKRAKMNKRINMTIA